MNSVNFHLIKIGHRGGLAILMLGIVLSGILLGSVRTGKAHSPENSFGPHGEPFTLQLDASALRATATATLAAANAGWQPLLDNETFPSDTLSGDWTVLPDTGNLRWGIGGIAAAGHAPYAAWVLGDQSTPAFEDGTEAYVDNLDTWLIYGPVTASQIWELEMEFDYFNRSQEGDYFYVGYSTDGENYSGFRTWGLMETWQHTNLQWQVSRPAQLWVAFGFTSNADGNVERGAWVDNVTLQANYGSRAYLPLMYRNLAPEPPAFTGFFDDFSDPLTGWNRHTYLHGDGLELMAVGYVNDTYRMRIPLDYDGRNNQLMGTSKAPFADSYTNYDLSVEHYFTVSEDQVADPKEGKGGLIFAANADFSTLYAFEWNFEGRCAVNKYTDASYAISFYKDDIDTDAIWGWTSCGDYGLVDGYNLRNHVRVEVRDNRATIYVDNGATPVQVMSFTDDDLRTHRRTGVATGSWDWTPVESRFDNYRLEKIE